MNKLYYTICVLLVAISAHAQFVHTNYAAVDANDVSGNFDSYNWVFLGQDSQEVTLDISFSDVTNDLSSLTLGWKASLNTRTGQVDYIVVSNSQITASTAQITFSVTNTAIPPDAVYQSELFGYTGASTGISRTLAQGIVDVRNSLYENDAQFTFPTNVAGDYVRKDGDFDQFSGLTGTNDQIWVADGSGGGAWSIAYQTASDANSAKITLNSTTNAVNTAGVAANLAKITLNSNTNAANTSAIAVLNTNAFTVDGLNSMQANADLGGNSLTNVLDGDFSGNLSVAGITSVEHLTNQIVTSIILDSGAFRPLTDNTRDLGSSSFWFDDIFVYELNVKEGLYAPNWAITNYGDFIVKGDLNVTSNITASGVDITGVYKTNGVALSLGGSLTPWTENVDGAGYSGTNFGHLGVISASTNSEAVVTVVPTTMAADSKVHTWERLDGTDLMSLDEDGDLAPKGKVVSGAYLRATTYVQALSYMQGQSLRLEAINPSIALKDTTSSADDYTIWVNGNNLWILNSTDTTTFLYVDDSENEVRIGDDYSLVSISNTLALGTQTNHPATYASGGQVYCVSNEVYAMDSGGDFNVLTPHPDFSDGEAVIMIDANVYDDEISFILKADFVKVMTGISEPSPDFVKTISTPQYIKRDWDTDEQDKADKRAGKIKAWEARKQERDDWLALPETIRSEIEPEEVTTEKPMKYVKRTR